MIRRIIKPYTEEELACIRLWWKLVLVWCVAYVLCHFFVWNPIKVKEVSDLQIQKYGAFYVDERARSHRPRASYYDSWMRLSVNGQKYQCDCSTYHCRSANYGKDKLKLDEVSFFIINQRYCYVAETVIYNPPKGKQIEYSGDLIDKKITKDMLNYWRPYILYSVYHKKTYQFWLFFTLFFLNGLLAVSNPAIYVLNFIYLFYVLKLIGS